MKKRNLRKQARVLVEHILDKDPISANSIFQKMILEAEEAREEEVADELDLDFDGGDEGAEEETDVAVDETEDAMDDSTGDGSIENMEESEGMSAADSDKVVDDIVEINCQINAKLISNLFDKIAELKNKVESLGLDENSREYLKYDVSIQYYSDKLQDLQNKTNPGIDQSKVEEALTKIETAIEQLSGEAGGVEGESDEDFDVDSPDEVSAKNDLADSDDETEAETDGDEAEDVTEDPEQQNDSDLSGEDEAEDEEETNSDDSIDELFS
jgi:hypothetical protein